MFIKVRSNPSRTAKRDNKQQQKPVNHGFTVFFHFRQHAKYVSVPFKIIT
jgi:hypothetical protein